MSLEQLSIHRTAPCTSRVALGLPSLTNHECWHWFDTRRQIMRRHCRCSLHIDRCDAQRSLCCSVQRLVCTSLAPSLISCCQTYSEHTTDHRRHRVSSLDRKQSLVVAQRRGWCGASTTTHDLGAFHSMCQSRCSSLHLRSHPNLAPQQLHPRNTSAHTLTCDLLRSNSRRLRDSI